MDRHQTLSKESLTRFAKDAGGLQIDTINVLDRAHYLTLFSRFGAYDKTALDELIYKERTLCEYWAHAACFVAAADLPYWRRAMLDYKPYNSGWGDWIKCSGKLIKKVEGVVRAQGPVSTHVFERPAPRKSQGWWDWKPAAHALQYLWWTGRIAVAERKNFQKHYDLMERVFPELEPAVDSQNFRHWHMRKSLHALGAANELDLGMYLTYPRYTATQRKKTLAALIKSGEVKELKIEGESAPWYALAEDAQALEHAEADKAPAHTTLLSPFDSFLWHRQRTKTLFGFDYKIEVYVPGPKRVHGYYSLPILHQGRLIGRLDPKNHRAQKRLEIHAVHFEESFAKGRGVDEGLSSAAQAIKLLAQFIGAERISIGRVHPASLGLKTRTMPGI